jgi:AcrR family transcriptional regulator
MEAASPSRELSGEKAQRIVDAMRTSVGLRGATGSTFDQVAREAGVSRGLLHYYFGTKERLLVEVVRRDCDLRMQRMSETITGVESSEALLGALVQSLNETIAETPEFFVILLELHSLARRNAEIASELAELHRRVRGHLAGLLEQAREQGAIRLAGEPGAVSEVLFALADGLAMRMLAEPERDYGATLATALSAARALVLPGEAE